MLLAKWTLDRNGIEGERIVPPHDRELADLLVNATTVGMDERKSPDETLSSLALDSDLLGSYEQVVDFAYSRSRTPLLTAAHRLGVKTVDGLSILVAQGGLSFELWTGHAAPLGAMRRAAEEC